MAGESLVTPESLKSITGQVAAVVALTTVSVQFLPKHKPHCALAASLLVAASSTGMAAKWQWSQIGLDGIFLIVFNSAVLFCAALGANELARSAQSKAAPEGGPPADGRFKGKGGQAASERRWLPFRSWLD